MLMLLEPATLIFLALSTLPVAALSYREFCGKPPLQFLRASVVLCLAGAGICGVASVVLESQCGHWEPLVEFLSPDAGSVARVELQRNPFFDAYEGSLRVTLVRRSDGGLIARGENYDCVMLTGAWERPVVNFVWAPGSSGGELVSGGRSILTLR